MENKLKALSLSSYLVGAIVAILSLLALPFTYGGNLWGLNLGITMVAIGCLTATATIHLVALLSKHYPAQVLLVLGTALLVSILGLIVEQNPALVLVQNAAIAVLALFVVARLVFEFVLAKPNVH